MISVKARAHLLGKTEDNILVNGKEANNMALAFTLVKKAYRRKENGIMARRSGGLNDEDICVSLVICNLQT